MSGASDYSAESFLNWRSGGAAMPALPTIFTTLFTTLPTDAGTGGVEVTGGGFARVQTAGPVVTNGTTANGNPTLHFATVPAWMTAVNAATGIAAGVGVTVRNATTPSSISAATTVLAVTGTTVTMSANAAGAGVGNGDTIVFSAWPAASASSGTEPNTQPASTTNGAVINFGTASANWGTVVGFGNYDAVTAGNFLEGDYIGQYQWRPVTCSAVGSGNGTVITLPAHGFSNGDTVQSTVKYGGTLPTFTQSNFTGALTVANVTTDTFTVTNGATAVWTSTTGDLQMKKVMQQAIPSGIGPVTYPASSFTLTQA